MGGKRLPRYPPLSQMDSSGATQSINIVNLLLSAIVSSGVVVALLTYWLTRRKMRAETEKTELEAEKLRRELSQGLQGIPAGISYELNRAAERTLYQMAGRNPGYDFRGVGGQIWKQVEGKDVAVPGKAIGLLTFEGGILNIQRSNKEGQYEVWLEKYIYDGDEKSVIPKNDLVEGKIGVRLACEVKVVGGEHTLRFVLKGRQSRKWLGSKERRVTEDRWTAVEEYMLFSPTEDCQFRFDDVGVSVVPSSIQIRNLVLTEKLPNKSPTR